VRIFYHEDRIGRHFFKSKHVDMCKPTFQTLKIVHQCFFEIKRRWAPFCSYFQGVCPDFQEFYEGFHIFCPDFPGFCPDFQGFCPDFHQIKTFGIALAHPLPIPLVNNL